MPSPLFVEGILWFFMHKIIHVISFLFQFCVLNVHKQNKQILLHKKGKKVPVVIFLYSIRPR